MADGGSGLWCPEPHVQGWTGEPHFDCDVCGRTGHQRFAIRDFLGRRINRNHVGCRDVDREIEREAMRDEIASQVGFASQEDATQEFSDGLLNASGTVTPEISVVQTEYQIVVNEVPDWPHYLGVGIHFSGRLPSPEMSTASFLDAYAQRVGLAYDSGVGMQRLGKSLTSRGVLALGSFNAFGIGSTSMGCLARSAADMVGITTLKDVGGTDVSMNGYETQFPKIADITVGATLDRMEALLIQRLEEIDSWGVRGIMLDNSTPYPASVSGLFTATPAAQVADATQFNLDWSAAMADWVGRAYDAVMDAFGVPGQLWINPGRTAWQQSTMNTWLGNFNENVGLLVEHFFSPLSATIRGQIIDRCRTAKNPLVFVDYQTLSYANWTTSTQSWKDRAAFMLVGCGGRSNSTGAVVPMYLSVGPNDSSTRNLSVAYTPIDALMAAIHALGPTASISGTGSSPRTLTCDDGAVTLNLSTLASTWT